MANEVDKTLVETSQENENIENKDSKILLGYSDDPAEKDSLGVDKYFKALEEYILSCPTPTTIAIQGDWGTGKSTAMGIIRDRIKDKTHVIEFNTWQYSKISGQSLVIPLLSVFLEKIKEIEVGKTNTETEGKGETKRNEKNSKEEKDLKETINTAIDLLSFGAYAYLDKKFGIGNIIDRIPGLLGEKGENSSSNSFSDAPYNQICEYFKKLGSIQEDLEESIKGIGDDKNFVIFVDDLDRLNPEDAVSLLEDLKTLLCIKRCIFVLALDQKIVNKGLSKKYGDGEDVAEYSKNFFDKIIQLPFSMPVNQYDISAYIMELKGEKDFLKEEDIPGIVSILEKFGESNPRTIKRLLNILQLYSHVKDNNGKDHKYDEYIKECFAIILIQISHKNIYDSICEDVKGNMSKRDPFLWIRGCDPDEDFWKKFEGNDEPILNILPEIFAHDFVRLCDVLSMTTVTGDGKYESRREEAEAISDHLIEYANAICKSEGWNSNHKSTGSVEYTKSDHATVNITVHPEHVNLSFEGDKDRISFLKTDSCGNVSLDSISNMYKFKAYSGTQGDLDTPYIIASISPDGNKGYFCLREVSTKNPASLELAGELLREHIK